MNAIHELDTLITIGDMNFDKTNDYRGNSYKYGCPFFLSYLKTQVIILLADKAIIDQKKKQTGAISMGEFGLYDPYYNVAGWTHPAIFLDVKGMRAYAQKEQTDPIALYQRTLLTLLAYAYQDPTNKINDEGIFTKLSMPKKEQKAIQYDEQAAQDLVDSYLLKTIIKEEI